MKTIHRVQVRRTGNTVAYIPAWMCSMLPADAVVISIVYEGERRPTFAPDQPVLELTDEGFGITPEMFHKALRFAKTHIGRNITVHCHIGQQRSKTLAEQLACVLPNYIVVKHRPDGVLLDTGPVLTRPGLIRKTIFGKPVPLVARTPVKSDFDGDQLGEPYVVETPTQAFIKESLELRRDAKNIVMFEDSDRI